MDFDRELFFLVNRAWTCQPLDFMAALVAATQLWLIPGAVVLATAVLRGGRRARTALLLAALTFVLGDFAVVSPAKEVVARPRPNETLSGVRRVHFRRDVTPRYRALALPLQVRYEGPSPNREPRSFPSGHAFNSFAVATILALWFRPWGWGFFGVSAAIAYLRVYAGLHYPSDVVPSALLGLLFGLGVLALFERLRRFLPARWQERLPSRHAEAMP